MSTEKLSMSKETQNWYAQRLSDEDIIRTEKIDSNWQTRDMYIENDDGSWYLLLTEVRSNIIDTIPKGWVTLELSGRSVTGKVGLKHAEIITKTRGQAMTTL